MKNNAETSRRQLLAGAVATAAAIQAAQPAKASQPDAELLAYGRELDECIQAYEIACAKYRPLWKKFSARLRDDPPVDGENNNSRYLRVYDEVGLKSLEQQGEHPDNIIGRADAPSRAIMAIPATSLAGLAVKARLAKFGASHIWDESDSDADWDHLVLRKLVDAVLDLEAVHSRGGQP